MEGKKQSVQRGKRYGTVTKEDGGDNMSLALLASHYSTEWGDYSYLWP